MKRRILVSLTAACVTALICVIVGKGAAAILDERVRTAIEKVAVRYGVECRYDAVSFVSLTGVSIAGLRVSVPGCPSFLRAADVKVLFDLRAYMTGKPYVTGIDADEAELILRRDAQGIWDLTRLSIREDSAAGKRASTIAWPLSIEVDEFAMTLDLSQDSATKTIETVEGTMDLPGKKVQFHLENGDERLTLSARRESVYRVEIDAESFGLGVLAPLVGRILDMASAKLTATGGLDAANPREWTVVVDGSIADLTVHHDLLARQATDGIAFGFTLDAAAANGEMKIHRAEFSVGGETAVVSGLARSASGSSGMKPEIDIRVSFPHVQIDRLVRSIPRSLVPHLPNLAADGSLHGEFHFYCDFENPRTLEYGFNGDVDSFAITGLGPDVNIDSMAGTFLHCARLPEGKRRRSGSVRRTRISFR